MENDFMTAVMSWAPILFMVLVFYFLLYRPQQRAKKERDDMLGSLKVGTKIITAGGIYGTITEIENTTLKLQIADRVVIQIARGSVGMIARDEKVDDDDDI